jgi:hypothetical protein
LWQKIARRMLNAKLFFGDHKNGQIHPADFT